MPTHDEVLSVIEELAPRVYAEPNDEPRFECRTGATCNRLGVCVDPTERNLYLAASDGVDFMITHHQWQREAAEAVAAKGMSIYRLHSAWDYAPDGNMATLARMLGLRNLVQTAGTLHGGIDLGLRELIERCQRLVGKSVIGYGGDLAGQVKVVGIIPGSGFIPLFRPKWENLAAAGCDTIISGDMTHAAARFAQCADIRLIDLGHSGLAKPGLAHLAYLLRCRLVVYGCDAQFYDDTYGINYFTAGSLPKQEESDLADHGPGGIILPFSR